MKGENLIYVRATAIILSCLVASLTLGNILTVITHGIDFEIPDENDFSWAIDPSEKRLLIMTGFTVNNHGAYDIDDIDISASVTNEEGGTLIDFSENDMSVSRGTDKRFDILIPIDLEELDITEWFSLLYENTVLNLALDIDVDYMFGLVHVTVDETLEYPWTAPLSEFDWDDDFLNGVSSLLKFSKLDHEIDLIEVEKSLIEYMMTMESLEYSSDGGHHLWFNNTKISEEMNTLSCELLVPLGHLHGSLAIGFEVNAGIVDGAPWVELQEVNLSYVKS